MDTLHRGGESGLNAAMQGHHCRLCTVHCAQHVLHIYTPHTQYDSFNNELFMRVCVYMYIGVFVCLCV